MVFSCLKNLEFGSAVLRFLLSICSIMTQFYDGHYSREKSGTVLFLIHFCIYMNGLLFKIFHEKAEGLFLLFPYYSLFPYLFLLILYFPGYLILTVND